MAPVALRTLWLVGYSLWCGGFVFYSGVVLTVLREHIPDHPPGAVTRDVTLWLNAAGLATLFVWWHEWRQCPPRPRLGLALMWSATILQTGLILLHWPLGQLYDSGDRRFGPWHQVYLWGATALFGVQIILLPLTIVRWRAADRATSPAPPV